MYSINTVGPQYLSDDSVVCGICKLFAHVYKPHCKSSCFAPTGLPIAAGTNHTAKAAVLPPLFSIAAGIYNLKSKF